mgnify:CR=1 FL=1
MWDAGAPGGQKHKCFGYVVQTLIVGGGGHGRTGGCSHRCMSWQGRGVQAGIRYPGSCRFVGQLVAACGVSLGGLGSAWGVNCGVNCGVKLGGQVGGSACGGSGGCMKELRLGYVMCSR